MHFLTKTIFVQFFCLMAFQPLAQNGDTILLMTGKLIEGKMTSRDSLYQYYDYTKRSGKTKSGKIDLERIFSITHANGQEEVVYQMDTTIGNYFNEQEMRNYIRGEQDAMAGFKAPAVTIAGVALTGGAGYVLSNSFFVFAVPFVYVVGSSVFPVDVRERTISDSKYLSDPAYLLGYERTARTKRLFNALVSGLAGTAAGVVIGQLTKDNDNE